MGLSLERLTRVVMATLAMTTFLWTDLTPAVARPSTPRPTAHLYGDSLALESVAYWTTLTTDLGYEAASSTYGGTAPCDFLKSFRMNMRRHAPDYVVVAFTGNNMTPCMADTSGRPLTGNAYYKAYRDDLSSFARIAIEAGSVIVFVGPPEFRDHSSRVMNSVYKSVTGRFKGALYVYGGTELTPQRHFRSTARCRASEIGRYGCGPDNRIKIRNPDGVHLCPRAYEQRSFSEDGCPSYAGGALRYAETLTLEIPPAICRRFCFAARDARA